MKKEIREILTTEHKTYYIADDGTEFISLRACEDYEYKQERDKRHIQWYACESIAEEMPAKLWYIRSDEEFEWLKKLSGRIPMQMANFQTKVGILPFFMMAVIIEMNMKFIVQIIILIIISRKFKKLQI